MKSLLLAAVVVALLPAVAFADRYDRGHRYDRGGYGYRDRSSSRVSVNLGFGSFGYRDYSYVNVGYSRGYAPRPVYYAPPRHRPIVVAPVYYHRPPPVVYCPPPVYYRPVYYSRGGYCGW